MTNQEEKALRALEAQARFVGEGAYGSDIFALLARILAYYRVRGTPPEEMVDSDTLLALIKHMIEETS